MRDQRSGDGLPLGRVGDGSHGDFVEVEPSELISGFSPGMELKFGRAEFKRPGTARIQEVRGNRLYFEYSLNVLVPSICTGDYIYECPPPGIDAATSAYLSRIVDEKLEAIGVTKLAPLSDLEKARSLIGMALELVTLRLLAEAAIEMRAKCPADPDSTEPYEAAVTAFDAKVEEWRSLSGSEGSR